MSAHLIIFNLYGEENPFECAGERRSHKKGLKQHFWTLFVFYYGIHLFPVYAAQQNTSLEITFIVVF